MNIMKQLFAGESHQVVKITATYLVMYTVQGTGTIVLLVKA